MDDIALELKDVVKRYGRRLALDGLSLRVPKGSAFGLVGSNGAGKTTTLSAIAGMIKTSSGSINLLGQGRFDPAISSGRLSLMPQDASLPPYAEVMDLLVFYAQLQGIPAGKARSEAMEALEIVNLQDRAGSAIRTLSHGMKRRVVIAQAFLGQPDLVLLDEPLSGLDPREVVHLRNVLVALKGKQTLVISSHNLHEIERICDHVAFIEKGKRVRQDSMTAVTGSLRSLTYLLETHSAIFPKLKEVLPDLLFHSRNGKLSCEYDDAKHSASEINAMVIPILLEAGIAIHEIHRGSQLEEVYLNARE